MDNQILEILIIKKEQFIVFVAQINNPAVRICDLESVKSCLNETTTIDIINES